VVVRPPGPYGGGLFQATDSRNINFQGFIIDGQANLVGAMAFYFFNASGSITKNTVMHWHHATPYAPSGSNVGVFISNATKLPLKVDHNTFSDMSNTGIQVTAPGGVTISHNSIRTYTEWLAGPPHQVTYGVTGILLEDTNGAKVLNNTIKTDQNLVNTGIPISRAIFLIDSSSNQIKSNIVDDYYHGIMLVASCPGVSSANMIANNKLYETKTGISIGTWGGCSTDVYQNNKVISNKVFTWTSVFDTGIRVAAFNNEVVTGNQIKGNTIGGYGSSPLDITAGNPNSGNKIRLVPPPGA
jgi:nitrous oxidase accessory protein NosD